MARLHIKMGFTGTAVGALTRPRGEPRPRRAGELDLSPPPPATPGRGIASHCLRLKKCDLLGARGRALPPRRRAERVVRAGSAPGCHLPRSRCSVRHFSSRPWPRRCLCRDWKTGGSKPDLPFLGCWRAARSLGVDARLRLCPARVLGKPG